MTSTETIIQDIMLSMETFGEWLVKQLQRKNMTQSQLAHAAGVSRGTISNIINGHKGVGKDLMIAIATELRLPIDEVSRAVQGLPAAYINDPWVKEQTHKLNLLDDRNKDIAARLLDALLDQQQKEGLFTGTEPRRADT